MSKSLGEQSLNAVIWVALDKLGGSSVNFLVLILLARLLSPEDFGVLAIVMVFFELSSVFVESGFYTALVREKEISEADKSTTFLFNLGSALLFYGILFFSAPAIAVFFKMASLTSIVRVAGLNLIITSLGIVQRATLTQRIDFRTQTLVRFLAVIVSGAAAVGMALQGLGVWSLVARFLLSELVVTLLFWVLNPWNPSWRFSRASFSRLFGFGSKILGAAILDKFYVHVYKLLIGKYFSSAALGFYTQAGNFSNMVINTLFRTIQHVSYPVLAKLQDDRERLREGYRKMVQLSSFVMIPALIALAALAGPVIQVLVGGKWLPATEMLQLLCLSGLTFHFSAINLNMLLVLGYSNLSLKLEVVKKINITLAIVIGLQYGIYGLIVGEVIAAWVNLFFNAYYSKRLLHYPVSRQIGDVLPTIGFSVLTGGALFLVRDLPLVAHPVILSALVLAAALVYLGLHWAARTEEMRLLKNFVLPLLLKTVRRQHS